MLFLIHSFISVELFIRMQCHSRNMCILMVFFYSSADELPIIFQEKFGRNIYNLYLNGIISLLTQTYLMAFLIIDIIHLKTQITFFYISPTISFVKINFLFRKSFLTVVTNFGLTFLSGFHFESTCYIIL